MVEDTIPRAEELTKELLKLAELKSIDPSNVFERCMAEKISRALAEHNVSMAYLFGSRARGTPREESDYDVAVLFELRDVTIVDEVELARTLAMILNVPPDRVDVVALNRADPNILSRVLKEGIPICYESEEKLRAWERRAYLSLLRQGDLDAIYISRALKKKS